MNKLQYWLTDEQKEYLRKVYRVLIAKINKSTSTFVSIQYKVEMEFINRVLGDLFYYDEDRSRLNELAKVYKDVG
jgi:hypothetical protein